MSGFLLRWPRATGASGPRRISIFMSVANCSGTVPPGALKPSHDGVGEKKSVGWPLLLTAAGRRRSARPGLPRRSSADRRPTGRGCRSRRCRAASRERSRSLQVGCACPETASVPRPGRHPQSQDRCPVSRDMSRLLPRARAELGLLWGHGLSGNVSVLDLRVAGGHPRSIAEGVTTPRLAVVVRPWLKGRELIGHPSECGRSRSWSPSGRACSRTRRSAPPAHPAR
jgi:hypothetical protein